MKEINNDAILPQPQDEILDTVPPSETLEETLLKNIKLLDPNEDLVDNLSVAMKCTIANYSGVCFF